jgi:beta-glucosidase
MTSPRRFWILYTALLLAAGPARTGELAHPLYRDATQPIEKRVEDLLGRMTLEEKVGQMNMPCVYEPGLGSSIPKKTKAV